MNKWDYTEQASYYHNRPNYAPSAINDLFDFLSIDDDCLAADIGAGTGNLTLFLYPHFSRIYAVEPNYAMREIGIKRTELIPQIHWVNGYGENTGLPGGMFKLVTFGSSFNTTNRTLALKESYRILKPNGWFVCMWNHRDLIDPIQSQMQDIIKKVIPNYTLGTRQESQADVIIDSKLFNDVHYIEGTQTIETTKKKYLDAWASVKNSFWNKQSLLKITKRMDGCLPNKFKIPYITRIWAAKRV